MLAPQVGADGLPRAPALGGLVEEVRRVVENVRVHGRKNNRLRAVHASLFAAHRDGRHVLDLAGRPIESCDAVRSRAVDDLGMERVGRGVAVFDDPDGVPLAESDLAVVPAAGNAHRAAFLLAAANLVRKLVRRGGVIELRRRLVVPGAPGLAAVHGDDRALVAHEQNNVRIAWVDPKILVIVAAGRASDAAPSLAAVGRAPSDDAGAIDDVRILRINLRHGQVAAADAQRGARVVGRIPPGFARVVRAVNPEAAAGLIIAGDRRGHGGVKALRIARRDGDIDLNHALGQTLRELPPVVAAVGGLVEPAARAAISVAVFPRPFARLPKAGVKDVGVRRVHFDVRAAGVFVHIKNLLPILAAVRRAINAALGVRAVGMPEHGGKHVVRVAGINGERRNLLAVAEAQMRPGLAAIGGFINAVAHREVRPLQAFAGRDVNSIRVGRRDGDGSNRLRGLLVEDGRPGAAVVVRFPNPAVHLTHVKNIGLARDACGRARPPAAVRTNQPPAQPLEHVVRILLGAGDAPQRHQQQCGQHPPDTPQMIHRRPPVLFSGAKHNPNAASVERIFSGRNSQARSAGLARNLCEHPFC